MHEPVLSKDCKQLARKVHHSHATRDPYQNYEYDLRARGKPINGPSYECQAAIHERKPRLLAWISLL